MNFQPKGTLNLFWWDRVVYRFDDGRKGTTFISDKCCMTPPVTVKIKYFGISEWMLTKKDLTRMNGRINLGKVSWENTAVLLDFVQMRRGRALHFWSIKGVSFFKNANNLNFKLFLGCPNWGPGRGGTAAFFGIPSQVELDFGHLSNCVLGLNWKKRQFNTYFKIIRYYTG